MGEWHPHFSAMVAAMAASKPRYVTRPFDRITYGTQADAPTPKAKDRAKTKAARKQKASRK